MKPILNDRRSIVRGLLVANVIAATLLAVFECLTDKAWEHDIGYLFILLLVGVAYSFIAIIVLALPLLLILNRLRIVNMTSSLIAGFLIGGVMAGLTERPSNGLMEIIRFNFSDHAVLRIWAFAVIGCASAMGFWLVRKSSSTSATSVGHPSN